MPFTPERRKQLDDIVIKMADQNAPKEDVDLIVNDFKSKYENEQPQVIDGPKLPDQSQTEKPGILSQAAGFMKKTNDTMRNGYQDFIIGQAKGIGSTIAGAASLGEKALNAASEKLFPNLGIKGSDKTLGKKAQEGVLKPEGIAQNIGFGTEKVGETLLPLGVGAKVAGLTSKAAKAVGAGEKVASIASKAAGALGVGGEQALITAAQGGNTKDIVTSAALGAGAKTAGDVASYGLNKLGDAFYAFTVPSTIAERGRDLRKQLNTGEAVSQTGISLTRNSLVKKIGNKIGEFGKQLDSAVGTTDAPRAFEDIANDAGKVIGESKLAKEMQLSPIDLDGAKETIGEVLGKYNEKFGGKMLSAVEQQQLKRDLGAGLVKFFDRSMTTPVKAQAFTEGKLYNSLNSFLGKNVKGYEDLNKSLAPLLESKERLLNKGAYSGYLTDVVAAGLGGQNGASLWEDPVGYMKNALGGVLVKRGLTSTAARTTAGTIAKSIAPLLKTPAFYQMFNQAIKQSQSQED